MSGVTDTLSWEEHSRGLPAGHAEGLYLCLPAGLQPWLSPPTPWETDVSTEPSECERRVTKACHPLRLGILGLQ